MNQNDPRLESLAREIHTFEDPWLFPQEHPVSGFFGMGPVMIIGDQPSTSPWSKANPGRRLFYGTLLQLGLEDSHITDVYKNRGKSGELERYVPADLQEHIEILKREIDIVRPKQIAALGRRAETLLHRHLPDLSPKAIYIQHFSYATRWGKEAEYAATIRQQLNLHPGPCTTVSSAALTLPAQTPASPKRHGAEDHGTSGLGALVEKISHAPPSAKVHPWTLRRDEKAHHHCKVRLSSDWMYLELSWKESHDAPECRVGLFRLHLTRLLEGDFIRYDPVASTGPFVRIRVVMASPSHFFVQRNSAGPALPLPP